MTTITRYRGRTSLAISLIAALLLAMPVHGVRAASNPNPGVLPPTSTAFGKTYGGWSAAWWQYVLGQPTTTATSNPLTDPTGANCGVGQSGPVFFLVGVVSGSATRDKCTVPAGKALFFPLVNGIDIHVPGDGLDDPIALWNDMQITGMFSISALHPSSSPSTSIDGVPVSNLDPTNTPYRACAGPVSRCSAPPFSVTLPDQNFFGLPAGPYTPAVADGAYLLLAPLTPGPHTIKFGGAGFLFGSFSQDITYHLTVSS